MVMYRVCKTLHVGGGRYLYPGTFTRLGWLDEGGVAKLVAVGAVGEVRPPPLVLIPGWERRAARMAGQGITDVVQLLDADTDTVVKACRAKAATVERWKEEVRDWLVVAPPAKGG